MQAAEGYVGISTLKNLRALSARRISTSAEKSHPLDSVAPPATILNDVPTFSVRRAFLDLHCLLACDAVHQIDEGAFIVIQMMPSRLHFYTFGPAPADADVRPAISRSVGVDCRLFLRRETPQSDCQPANCVRRSVHEMRDLFSRPRLRREFQQTSIFPVRPTTSVSRHLRFFRVLPSFLFWLNANPINPSTTKTAPATISQCGYSIAESIA